MRLQSLVQAVFPPECLSCGARIDADFSLCGACWAETDFILGAVCDLCGVGLPGAAAPDERLICDDCLSVARPWDAGRAVMAYRGVGRRLVLGLKHGDRADVARAAGPWMARAGRGFWEDDPLLVPVPLHWRRLAARRFNQSALLARALARETGLSVAADALLRGRATGTQDGRDRDGRFENLEAAIAPHPKYGHRLSGRAVVLIDDVMTSGATFSAAAQACAQVTDGPIRVMALARVSKDP